MRKGTKPDVLVSMEQKYDQNFQIVFEAIKQLLEVEAKPKKSIGFTGERPQDFSGAAPRR